MKETDKILRFEAEFKYTAVISLFLFFFLSFLQTSLYNKDFWWHIATGKYVFENQTLPEKDPFAYTTPQEPTQRKTLILKGYWLAEIIFYEVYQTWNAKGIIILRALIMTLFLFFVFLTIKKQGASHFLALLLTAGVFIYAGTTIGERPQLFTFLCFSIVYFLLEDFRKTGSKKIFFIPPLVLVLSNMHPGYIVCIFLVSLFLIGSIFHHFINRSHDVRALKTILIVWALTIFASMANPSGLNVFAEIFSLEKHTKGIIEFMSPLTLYMKKYQAIDYFYLGFFIFSFSSIKYLKKMQPVHILYLLIFTIMSLTAIRYVIFYMCIMAPILAALIMNIKEEKLYQQIRAKFDVRESFLYFVASLICLFLVITKLPAFAKYEFKEDIVYAAPKGATDFIAGKQINGNMFNEYGFGGYLIWRLYPDKKVFFDGRSLDPDIHAEYNFIAAAKTVGTLTWEDLLQKYNVTYIIMPPLLPRGEIYPLVEELIDSNDWILIYNDHLSLVFLKNNTQNIFLLKKYAIDKKEALNTIILQASSRAMKSSVNPYYLITLGKVFFRMGKFEDSEKAFLIAQQRDPRNIVIKDWLYKIKQKREEGN